jgi:hypothetical protein
MASRRVERCGRGLRAKEAGWRVLGRGVVAVLGKSGCVGVDVLSTALAILRQYPSPTRTTARRRAPPLRRDMPSG